MSETVYIAIEYGYESQEILGVFATKDKAHACIDLERKRLLEKWEGMFGPSAPEPDPEIFKRGPSEWFVVGEYEVHQ